MALRLVACAQNGLDVSLSSLNLPVSPPRFVRLFQNQFLCLLSEFKFEKGLSLNYVVYESIVLDFSYVQQFIFYVHFWRHFVWR